MAMRMKSRAGESAEQMMRRFKKMCEKEGLTKDIKRRAYYEKPSERKQRAQRKSEKRHQQLLLGVPLKKGPPGTKPTNGPPARGPAGRGGPSRGPARR